MGVQDFLFFFGGGGGPGVSGCGVTVKDIKTKATSKIINLSGTHDHESLYLHS